MLDFLSEMLQFQNLIEYIQLEMSCYVPFFSSTENATTRWINLTQSSMSPYSWIIINNCQKSSLPKYNAITTINDDVDGILITSCLSSFLLHGSNSFNNSFYQQQHPVFYQYQHQLFTSISTSFLPAPLAAAGFIGFLYRIYFFNILIISVGCLFLFTR